MTKALEIIGLSFAYDKNLVLDGLSMSVDEGDFLAIIGENGAGKSTLLNIILGNLPDFEGEILVFGDSIRKDDHFRDIAYVSQDAVSKYKNFPTTIEEVIKVHLSYLRSKKDPRELLERVGLLDHRKKSLASLSGGQLQRLGLCLALIKEAKLIFLDEPTTGIDEKFAEDFYRFLSNFKKEGKTIVMVTHQLDLAASYVDYAIRISKKSAQVLKREEMAL